MINRLNLSIPLIALLLVSCAGDISSQSSSESSPSNTFTVIFDSRGGSNVPNQIVEPNSFISPPNVSKEGHNLEGWYTSLNGGLTLENKWNFFTDRVNFNFTLYASWTVNPYTITFETNGGNLLQNLSYNYGDSLRLPIPVKNGYLFEGWYIDANLSNKFEVTNMPAINLTLYSKWQFYGIVSTGYNFSLFLNSNNESYAWGRNFYGQLGNGQTGLVNSNMPEQILFNNLHDSEYIIQLEAGLDSSTALTNYGNVYTWGANYLGQLGDGGSTNKSIPQKIIFFDLLQDERIVLLSSSNHTIALSSLGRIFSFGDNGSGQLGDGTTIRKNTPVNIVIDELFQNEYVVDISTGYEHSLVLTNFGRVFGWGGNYNGQIGIDTISSSVKKPTHIIFSDLIQNEKIKKVETGVSYSMAISTFGKLYAWGDNYFGQLGNGNFESKIKPTKINIPVLIVNEEIVSLSGSYHTLAITSLGRVLGWGNNQYGEIGNGTTSVKNAPVIVNFLDLNENEAIVQINAGDGHSIALTNQGNVFTWGSNGGGQLGNGTNEGSLFPTKLSTIIN